MGTALLQIVQSARQYNRMRTRHNDSVRTALRRPLRPAGRATTIPLQWLFAATNRYHCRARRRHGIEVSIEHVPVCIVYTVASIVTSN
jgi:hypothetical protein